MIERCGGAGLALEALAPFGAVRDLRRQGPRIATSRPSSVSRARHTSPIPPVPMGPMDRRAARRAGFRDGS